MKLSLRSSLVPGEGNLKGVYTFAFEFWCRRKPEAASRISPGAFHGRGESREQVDIAEA